MSDAGRKPNNNYNNKYNNNNNNKKPWFNKKNWNNYKKKGDQKNNNNSDTNNGTGKTNSYNNYNRFQNQNKKLYNDNFSNDNDQIIDDESEPVGLIFDATTDNEDYILQESQPDCPFPMWNLYFPKEVFKNDSEAHKTILKFLILIESLESQFDINKIKDKGFFNFDYKLLCSNPVLLETLPDFSVEFILRPEFYLKCFSLSIHQFILNKFNNLYERFKNEKISSSSSCITSETTNMSSIEIDYQKELASFELTNEIPTIKARILNFTPITRIKQLKSNMYDKFVSVVGTVVRITNSKPLVKRMAFECKKCFSTFQIYLNEGKYRYPTRCANKSCNSKIFIPLPNHHMTKVVEWQTMKLQEVILDPKDTESGRIPRTILCELYEDLTGVCIPGDLITVNGILRAHTLESTGVGRSNKEKCTFVFFISVISIQGNASSEVESSKNMKDMEFSLNDLRLFEEIKREPNVFKTVVHSLCPSIFGHELVKAGLILGLFGGSKRLNASDVSVRSDPHVLVVGDPGLGKSQLLRACANVSPRGIYVCGNSTTAAGLTVSLSKEAGDDFALEAGALICAHNGSCCIDEFDKMGSQQQTLLEAMEQQCISIAKGGIVCSLPCKTTVLAAANPCGGHYDKSRTVTENLKISGPLLSRFDLLFILLDKPDEELDYKLSSHILHLHSKKTDLNRNDLDKTKYNKTDAFTIQNDSVERASLLEKLLLDPDEKLNFDPLPHQLLRKYIMYAKRICEPVIGKEAAEELRSFYIYLRQKNQRSNGVNPITMRQLESLTRLTQARAKVELRKVCSRNDALEVIEIMKNSMFDYNENEIDFIDLSQSLNTSNSKSAGIKQFVSILQKVSIEKKTDLFNYDQIKDYFQKSNLKIKNVSSVNQLIDLLNNQNYILKRGQNLYKLAATTF